MSEQQGDPPPGWPTSPEGMYGPGKTIPGDPNFDVASGAFPTVVPPLPLASSATLSEVNTPQELGAPPGIGSGAAPVEWSPLAGAAESGRAAGAAVPPTIVDGEALTDVGDPRFFTATPHVPIPPTNGMNAAPYAPTPPTVEGRPFAGPADFHPLPPTPPITPARQTPPGPSLLLIGASAFVVIGALVGSFFWFRSRRSLDEGPPSPTVALPPAATVTSEPPPEPTPVAPTASAAATATPTVAATRPPPPTTTSPPQPTGTTTAPPQPTTTSTTTTPPQPTTTTPPQPTTTTPPTSTSTRPPRIKIPSRR